MYMNAKKYTFNIDDRFPVDIKGKTLLAARSPNGAWWLPLLEKAFAKLNVNYMHLDGGFQQQALRALTGMPVTEHKIPKEDVDTIWNNIYSAD